MVDTGKVGDSKGCFLVAKLPSPSFRRKPESSRVLVRSTQNRFRVLRTHHFTGFRLSPE
jgi:hypothetical protein